VKVSMLSFKDFSYSKAEIYFSRETRIWNQTITVYPRKTRDFVHWVFFAMKTSSALWGIRPQTVGWNVYTKIMNIKETVLGGSYLTARTPGTFKVIVGTVGGPVESVSIDVTIVPIALTSTSGIYVPLPPDIITVTPNPVTLNQGDTEQLFQVETAYQDEDTQIILVGALSSYDEFSYIPAMWGIYVFPKYIFTLECPLVQFGQLNVGVQIYISEALITDTTVTFIRDPPPPAPQFLTPQTSTMVFLTGQPYTGGQTWYFDVTTSAHPFPQLTTILMLASPFGEILAQDFTVVVQG